MLKAMSLSILIRCLIYVMSEHPVCNLHRILHTFVRSTMILEHLRNVQPFCTLLKIGRSLLKILFTREDAMHQLPQSMLVAENTQLWSVRLSRYSVQILHEPEHDVKYYNPSFAISRLPIYDLIRSQFIMGIQRLIPDHVIIHEVKS
jgi:hypothetical protein